MAWTIIPLLIETWSLDQPREFDILYAYNFNKAVANPEGTKPDIEIDLTFRYPKQTLIVDDQVEISGVVFLNDTSSTITRDGFLLNSREIKSLTIYIDNAQKYPSERDKRGIIRGADLIFDRNISYPNELRGATTITWTVEGTYHANLAILLEINKSTNYIFFPGQYPGVAITVYSKTQDAQRISNEAMLYLTLAIYFITVVGSIPTFFSLQDWKMPTKIKRRFP